MSSEEAADKDEEEENGSEYSEEPDDRQEGEEGRESKGMGQVVKVSKEEREDHERTHTPFRPWCQYCVQGRGRNEQHKKNTDKDMEGRVPKASMDYFYMSTEDEKASKNPLLVIVNEASGEKYARAVRRKGVRDDTEMLWLVKDICEELESWGHRGGSGGKIILKTDGEAAIKKLAETVAKQLGGEVIPEQPAKGESQSNGAVEEAGKTVREFTRVLRMQT